MGRPRKNISLREPVSVPQTSAPEAPTEQESPTISRSGRPTRASINGRRDKLSVQGMEPGWHYCWVNDYNVDLFTECGYSFVEHDVIIGHAHVNAASQVGGRISRAVGNGVTGFLMRCTEQDYLDEMAAVHNSIDEDERSLIGNLNSNTEGRYGEVKIEQNKPLRR